MIGQKNVISCCFGLIALWNAVHLGDSFTVSNDLRSQKGISSRLRSAAEDDSNDDEAARLQKQADEIREQIRKMEEKLGDNRRPSQNYIPQQTLEETEDEEMTLKRKTVLVVGANGRLGSMVCRYLLRNHPQCQVVAAVHTVSENSSTNRGYGRLSYEVGAEDGVGQIGAAWSGESRTATFEYADYMRDYNLQNLRLVEVELLDPVQCQTITEGVDSVIWCATDFNGNKPRAISGLNVAFLFRAVADPAKGRVEVEGLENLLGGLKLAKQDRKYKGSDTASKSDPINFVLVSAAKNALGDFETPFGSFHGIKRQGENMVLNDFPSLSTTVIQMSLYDDNFVEENLDITTQQVESNDEEYDYEKSRRRINRRDAARFVVDSLTDETLVGKTSQIWTALRG